MSLGLEYTDPLEKSNAKFLWYIFRIKPALYRISFTLLEEITT